MRGDIRHPSKAFPGGKKKPGGHLLSRPPGAVSSAQGGLTSVFGMGTGIAPPPWPPGDKSGKHKLEGKGKLRAAWRGS